jgi:hypothetical protein
VSFNFGSDVGMESGFPGWETGGRESCTDGGRNGAVFRITVRLLVQGLDAEPAAAFTRRRRGFSWHSTAAPFAVGTAGAGSGLDSGETAPGGIGRDSQHSHGPDASKLTVRDIVMPIPITRDLIGRRIADAI